MTSLPICDLLRFRVFRLAVAGLAVAVTPLSERAHAVPPHSVQAQYCERGGPVIALGNGRENGCCFDNDHDGYVDTCISCDENGANCRFEELGEDLSEALLNGAQAAPQTSGQASVAGRSGPATTVVIPLQSFQAQ